MNRSENTTDFVILCLSPVFVPSRIFLDLWEMEHYSLLKRQVLSFETKQYEDGDIDYNYVVDMYSKDTVRNR